MEKGTDLRDIRLGRHLRRKPLSLEALSKRSGLSATTLSLVERGGRRCSEFALYRIAGGLGIDIEEAREAYEEGQRSPRERDPRGRKRTHTKRRKRRPA